MTKDDLLEFLDRVGARSLENYLTQESDDPQVGLDERLDWARSRLADPRYSRAARFLVSQENEIRGILREGEQTWLHRQISGATQTMPPVNEDTASSGTPNFKEEEAPPPPTAPPLLMTPPEGTTPPILNAVGDAEPEPEPQPEPEPEMLFVPPLDFQPDPLDRLGDMDLLSLRDQSPYDADFEPTMVGRRSMLTPDPEDTDTNPFLPRYEEDPLETPLLNDPATEAVEGDWDGAGMGAFMPTISGRSKPASDSLMRGNLFEDVLGDQDTHASFDTSNSQPSLRDKPTRKAPRPVPSAQRPQNTTLFAEDPVETTPGPASHHTPITSSTTGVLNPPDEFPGENTASTRFVPAKKKERRYDPALLGATLLLSVAIAFLFFTIRNGRAPIEPGAPISAQVLVQRPPPNEPQPAPVPVVVQPAEPVPEVAPEPAPTPKPVPVKPRPVRVAPKPVPIAPKPVPVAPKPVPVAPKPVPIAPAPVIQIAASGRWAGTAGSGAMTMMLSEEKTGEIAGTARLTVSGAPRDISVRGTFFPESGKLEMSEVDGTITFSGKLTESTAHGTWLPSAGSTARQWFVVRKN